MPRSYNERCEIEVNPFRLTNVQMQTMQVMCNGYSIKGAAKLLHISEGSVKERLAMIRSKMDVDTTLQAAVMWVHEVKRPFDPPAEDAMVVELAQAA